MADVEDTPHPPPANDDILTFNGNWEERLAAFVDEIARRLTGEVGARFARDVDEYLKEEVCRSPLPAEEAFQAAADRLLRLLQAERRGEL